MTQVKGTTSRYVTEVEEMPGRLKYGRCKGRTRNSREEERCLGDAPVLLYDNTRGRSGGEPARTGRS